MKMPKLNKKEKVGERKKFSNPILNCDEYSTLANKYKELFETYYNNRFHVGKTCSDCGITRNKWYRMYNSNELFKQLVDESFEYIVDTAERKLLDEIEEGNTRLITWFLEKRAKNRGYGDDSNEKQTTINFNGIDNPFAKIRENENIN